jgi:5-(carboxyamino)imidazole ribonucleotide synthase
MKQVGIIGGGQLAWMMGGAAAKLGIKLSIQTPSYHDPAVAIADETIFAAVNDASATAVLAKHCDVITFENEFVNLTDLLLLEQQGIRFYPQLASLVPLLDKYHQRQYVQSLGLAVPQFFPCEKPEDVLAQMANLSFPVVLKARRLGYDGQGTSTIRDFTALSNWITAWSQSNTEILLEEFVPFVKELAVMAARSADGEIMTYAIVETQQVDQVCRRAIVPAEITFEQTREIEKIAHILLTNLQAVGVFGIELFLTANGKIMINEIAPRTHNSGHFSLDASVTSQFEQHLRAVCGLPLGSGSLLCKSAVMVNLLGYEDSQSNYQSQRQQLAEIPQSHVHWYSKVGARKGRKLGHVTVLLAQQSQDLANQVIHEIESIWYPAEKLG